MKKRYWLLLSLVVVVALLWLRSATSGRIAILDPWEQSERPGVGYTNKQAEVGPSKGAIVFEDPDGYWSLGCDICLPGQSYDLVDEVYLPFNPDQRI